MAPTLLLMVALVFVCLFCALHIQLITTVVVNMILSILFFSVDSSMGSNAISIMPCIQMGLFFFTHVNCWLSLCVQRQQEHGVGGRGSY